MQPITKKDIAKVRRAIQIAEEGEDYQLVEWAWAEIESVMNKAEAALDKIAQEHQQPCHLCRGTHLRSIQDSDSQELVLCDCVGQR